VVRKEVLEVLKVCYFVKYSPIFKILVLFVSQCLLKIQSHLKRVTTVHYLAYVSTQKLSIIFYKKSHCVFLPRVAA